MNIISFGLEIVFTDLDQIKANMDVLEFQAAPTTSQETITSHRFPCLLLKHKLLCPEAHDRP